MKKIVITTGDIDGIGLEVTAKALVNLGPCPKHQFFIFRSENCQKKYLKLIDKKFHRLTFDSYQHYCQSKLDFSAKTVIDICSDSPPTEWVFLATRLGLKKEIDAVVTGPLSKTESFKTHKVLGHTDIFRSFVKTNVFMHFIGQHFSTMLLTDHIPLQEVPKKITKKLVGAALKSAYHIVKANKMKKPIAVIGLNPHAGEEGLLGNEEKKLIYPEILKFNTNHDIKAHGPLVPDVAFCKNNWKKFSLFISPYHDQGLTAFKLVHGQNLGIQYSAGLPFVRTSVDHGTAKELFKKNKADYGSMKMAIEYAIKFIK